MSNNLQRILTAIVAAPVVLLLAYLGGWPFAGLVALIGLVGQTELYHMVETTGAAPHRTAGLVLGALVIAALARPLLWPLASVWFIGFVIFAPFLLSQQDFVPSFTVTLAGAAYPTGLLGSLVLLREARGPSVSSDVAFWLVVLTFLLVWATDIFAYYIGRWVGATPLAPTISPNKTWEGTVGGLAAALGVAVGMKMSVLPFIGWPHVFALAAIGGGVSQVGDLMESQMKRSTGAKDASSILPGHGGMLDRFDSMVVAAPLIYLYLHSIVGLVQ